MTFWICSMTDTNGHETPLGDWRGDTPLEAARATKRSNSHDSSIATITVRGAGKNKGQIKTYRFDEL